MAKKDTSKGKNQLPKTQNNAERGVAQNTVPEPMIIPKEGLPTPLVEVLTRFENEAHPFSKVHRLMDTVEVIIKLHTSLIIGKYFDHELVPPQIREKFCAILRTPALGDWWGRTLDFAKIFKTLSVGEQAKKLVKNITEGVLYRRTQTDGDNVIYFRNRYAHGSTPPDERCEEDIKKYFPRVAEILDSADYLREMQLFTYFEGSGLFPGKNTPAAFQPIDNLVHGRTYAVLDGETIDLHPLYVFRRNHAKYIFYNDNRNVKSPNPGLIEPAVYSFYNDFKSKKVAILNYEECIHEIDQKLNEDRRVRFFPNGEDAPKSDWFGERIGSLTDRFVGRLEEINDLYRILNEREQGVIFLWGVPGIGKTAFLWHLLTILRMTPKEREALGISLPEGKTPKKVEPKTFYTAEYFIRRDMGTNKTEDMLNYLLNKIHKLTNIPFTSGETNKARSESLINLLYQVSARLGEDERLLLIIDGLDEAVEVTDLLDALPRVLPPKVIAVYSSRVHPEVRTAVFDNLDRENHLELPDLKGLTQENTRAMLYECVNKYLLKREYVEAVVTKSEGNPLYLKMLCNALLNREIQLNDIDILPKNLTEMFRSLIARLYGKMPEVVSLLRVLAVSKDFLSAKIVEKVMGVPCDTIKEQILPHAREVLVETTDKQGNRLFQIFHESLRQYLKEDKDFSEELNDWNTAFISWASGWKELNNADDNGYSQLYALKYLPEHLLDKHNLLLKIESPDVENVRNEMIALIENREFQKTSFRKIGNDYYLRKAFKDLQLILKKIDENGNCMNRILTYAVKMNTLRDELYHEQLTLLVSETKKKNFDNVIDYARMGALPSDRIMLILRAIWNARSFGNQHDELKEQIDEWLEDVRDISLEKFNERSFEKFSTC